MKWGAAFLAIGAIGGCAGSPGNAAQGAAQCSRGLQAIEVRDSGVVTQVLGTHSGPGGSHEGFFIRLGAREYRVEDNIDLTGSIPLHAGERVALQGELACNDLVIHWTHRDPRGRHAGGYLQVDGTTYQ